MKVRRLVIRNVASIESAELDFESGALGDAPLFLICGETGAGKTTILDCITLALYGRTPRYDGASVRNACAIGGYAFNDARQLVRRGATSASARLEIVGNDGRRYAAEWSVDAYVRGANRGMLKEEAWSWRDCSEGGIVWTKVRDCEAVALRAVGLGFDQFCRTTLLAQGQFTKFLLGSEDAKAEILERLTDTTRYSELGKAIAARYARLDREIGEIEGEIARMSGLGDRRGEVEGRIRELDGIIAEVGGRSVAATARLNWLLRSRELSESLDGVKAQLVVAFAALKALERKTASDLAAAKAELGAVVRELDADAGKATLYENAGVVLAHLGDVRNARSQKCRAECARAERLRAVPELERRLAEATERLKAAERKVSAAEGVIEAEEAALAARNRKRVQQDRDAVEKLRGNLKGLEGKVGGIESLRASVGGRECAVAAKRGALARREAELPGAKAALDSARAAFERARRARDDQKKLVDDGIEKLVADLKVGEVCPVCGNRIERLQAEGHFRALFQSLDRACDAAEEEAGKAERSCHAAEAAIGELRSVIESETALVEREVARIRREQAEAEETARRLGVGDCTSAGVRRAIGECDGRVVALDARLAEIEALDRKVRDLKLGFRELEQAKASARDGVELAEKALAESRRRIELLDVSVVAEGERAAKKLAEAKALVSDEGWIASWERDSDAVESALKEASLAHASRKARRPRLEARLAVLERTGRQIDECVARAVGKVAALSGVGPGNESAESTAEVEGLVGRLEACEIAFGRHQSVRPEGLEASDTVEGLGEVVESARAEGDAAMGERGRCQQQIADDDRCARERRAKREAADRLIAERGEWQPIYSRFGDNDGRKIRKEIQSYVLMNVLVKANHYLRQLSERYVLSCEGLTLSVVDAFEGGTVRPVNTLSGGEQFLVSLALALGLAGMCDTGLSVDMLLIDEGFGTLSGEHLNSAIEALERLNALTGTRKVGVISHVERLRERIRTHIEVSRRGHDPSEVKVVVNGSL